MFDRITPHFIWGANSYGLVHHHSHFLDAGRVCWCRPFVRTGKDLEILILRHQLDILERKQKTPGKPDQVEKMTLAVLTDKLKQTTNRSTRQLRATLRIFQHATVLKWLRFLYGGNTMAKDAVCVLLHRIGNKACSFGRHYNQPRFKNAKCWEASSTIIIVSKQVLRFTCTDTFQNWTHVSLSWVVSGYFRLGLMSLQADFVAWSTRFREELADHEHQIF